MIDLRIGIAKGRGFPECIKLFKFQIEDESFYSGKLTYYHDPALKANISLIRGENLPWMLHNKYIDIAVGSNILFKEYYFPNLKLFSNLKIKPCKFSLLTKSGFPIREKNSKKNIATKFPNVTYDSLLKYLTDFSVIYFKGSLEAGLMLNIFDAIVDFVETGWTIDRFDLNEEIVLFDVSHSIWVHGDDKNTIDWLHENISNIKLLEKKDENCVSEKFESPK